MKETDPENVAIQLIMKETDPENVAIQLIMKEIDMSFCSITKFFLSLINWIQIYFARNFHVMKLGIRAQIIYTVFDLISTQFPISAQYDNV